MEPSFSYDQDLINLLLSQLKLGKEKYDLTSLKYEYVDSEVAFEKSKDLIMSSEIISIDCEGDNLSRKGKLSVVQICTDNNEIFVLDYITLNDGLIKFLKLIMSNPKILKLGFDFRNDADILLHQFGIEIENLLDVQLVDFWKQTSLNLFSSTLAEDWKESVKMGKIAWGDCFLPSLKSHSKEQMSKLKEIQKGDWTKRPLQENEIRYAASDVMLIMHIFKEFEQQIIAENLMDKFKNVSKKYCKMFAEKSVRKYDCWEANQVTPIQVFSEMPYLKHCKLCCESVPVDMVYKASKICLRCHLKKLI